VAAPRTPPRPTHRSPIRCGAPRSRCSTTDELGVAESAAYLSRSAIRSRRIRPFRQYDPLIFDGRNSFSGSRGPGDWREFMYRSDPMWIEAVVQHRDSYTMAHHAHRESSGSRNPSASTSTAQPATRSRRTGAVEPGASSFLGQDTYGGDVPSCLRADPPPIWLMSRLLLRDQIFPRSNVLRIRLLPAIGVVRFPRKRGGIDNRGRDARETEEVRPGVS